jgi:hypothetical protein
MQRELKYNLQCPESDRMLGELFLVYNTINEGLHKKEYPVYEGLLQKLHQITAMQVNIFNRDINDFRMNDSDNENNYEESVKNIPEHKEYEEDSVSEYETDSEDEDYKKSKTLLEIHDENCQKYFKKIREFQLFEIE